MNKTILAASIIISLLVGVVVGYSFSTKKQVNIDSNPVPVQEEKFPEVSDETGTIILGIFGLKFDYPSNFINKWGFEPEKNGDAYIVGNEFKFMDSGAFGRFTYDVSSFAYAAKSDNYLDGGSEGECPRRNVVQENLSLSNGITVIYKHGGEIQNCFEELGSGGGQWYADPSYAEGFVQINKTYNGVHFSELQFTNRNLALQDFKKILQSIRPI